MRAEAYLQEANIKLHDIDFTLFYPEHVAADLLYVVDCAFHEYLSGKHNKGAIATLIASERAASEEGREGKPALTEQLQSVESRAGKATSPSKAKTKKLENEHA